MHKDFEKYRPGRRLRGQPDNTVTVAARLPLALRLELDAIAVDEGDDLTGLFIEGCARVIEDRRKDPAYKARIAESQQRQIETAAAKMVAKQAALQQLGFEIAPAAELPQ